MSAEKIREEFEIWAKQQAESVNYPHMQFVLAKYENGDYRTTWVDMAWIGWQASRESLVIELPKPWQTNVGAMMTPNGVKFAIESAGLKFVVEP